MLDNLVCIIPARAGSKGIPGKNMQRIAGIPLVGYSITQALAAGIKPTSIVVSSDGDDILNLARDQYGVIAHRRPSAISTDTSSTEETLLYVTEEFSADHVLLLQPTSPIRFPSTINSFLDFYTCHEYDSVFTATKFDNFFWSLSSSVIAESSYNIACRSRRQDLLLQDYRFFENGNMYLTKLSILKNQKNRLGGKIGIFPISELEGLQIDTFEELELIRSVLEGRLLEQSLKGH